KRNKFYIMEGKIPIKLTPRSPEYATQLQVVAEEIKHVLQKMRGDTEEKKKLFYGKTVSLAEKEEDVDHQWELIRAYLRDLGASVLPVEGTYPDSELEFSSAFKADLAKAHLFIQLLSPVDEAIRSKDGKSSRARLQYSLAMNDARQIPIMQWRKPGI